MQYIYVMEYKKGDDICKSYLYLHLSFYFLCVKNSKNTAAFLLWKPNIS